MSTTIRPEVSKKNKYWIDRHRYYELKHFCLQYNTWKKISNSLIEPARSFNEIRTDVGMNRPTEISMILRADYIYRMEMVEKAAKEADMFLEKYILKSVTENLSYTYLKTVLNIPCSRDLYYDRYRRFFWILNEYRK